MEYEFLKYPSSVKALAEEIKRVTADYSARRLGNDDFKNIFLWYANYCGDKLFQGQDYNPTIKAIIGKRRIKLIDMVLDGYQITLFKGVK